MYNSPSPISSELPGKKTIVKNVLYNLIGYGSPLLFAVVLIPPLIAKLGDERFGILSIAWMVLGYFSLLDFGIGRSLTKIISERIALSQKEQIPGLFWTALVVMLLGSLLVMIPILLLAPFLVDNFFNVSENVKTETLNSFYALALSIPIIATTAALRGVLEAFQKFFAINLVRIFLGVLTFLVPVSVLFFINSLFWVIVFMIVVRISVWLFYLYMCLKCDHLIKSNCSISFKSFKPVLKFSLWISIANVVGPIISYSDRIIIGAAISTASITYYSTPYEIVTKLLLIPGALVGVLFPVFASSFAIKPQKAMNLFTRGVKYIFIVIYPIVFIIVAFSFEGMQLWLGKAFAEKSSMVLKFLSIGILMNSLSIIPNTFFQGTGKPHIPTLWNLSVFPFYIFGMWVMVNTYEIQGAAFFYMIIASLDAFTMYYLAHKNFGVNFQSLNALIFFISFVLILGFIGAIQLLMLKIILSLILLTIFILSIWRFFLNDEEKRIFILKIWLLNLKF